MNNRLMTRSGGSETLRYNLYTTPSHTSIWGDGSTGTLFVSGTGNGSEQRYSVHGRMPAQSPTPNPGGYSDTITVTMTY
jgi:spore coat protein U-like protein